MARFAMKIVVALGLAGCVRLPSSASMCAYSALAHPTMSPDAISIGLDGHVRAVSEGATGGLGRND
jgi:hypothetical protein